MTTLEVSSKLAAGRKFACPTHEEQDQFWRDENVDSHVCEFKFDPTRSLTLQHPHDPRVIVRHLYADTRHLPLIKRGQNLRYQDIEKTKYRKILNDMLEDPMTDLKVQGVLLVAEQENDVQMVSEDTIRVRFGRNGGQNNGAHTLLNSLKARHLLPEDQTRYLMLTLVSGHKDPCALSIAHNGNVKDGSRLNLLGYFDFLKDGAKKVTASEGSLYEEIKWTENDTGNWPVEEVIKFLTCLNIGLFPNGKPSEVKHPSVVYNANGLTKFSQNRASFANFSPVLHQLLTLICEIRSLGGAIVLDRMNHGGDAAKATALIYTKGIDPISGTPKALLANSTTYITLASFRPLLKDSAEGWNWVLPFPGIETFVRDSLPNLIDIMLSRPTQYTKMDDYLRGSFESANGSADKFWAKLYRRVTLDLKKGK